MSKFEKEMEKVDAFFQQYPPSQRKFIRSVVLYNAIHHADRGKLFSVPLFDEAADEPPESTEEVKPTPIRRENVAAWNNL